jgi:DNA-binding transcriptional regulator YdaS (Cro superfamily)
MMIDLKHLLYSRQMTLSAFAALAGVNKSTVTRWAQKGIPAENVVDVESRTGVPRFELRPDLYTLARPAKRGGRAA